MPRDFFPRRDYDVREWTKCFGDKIAQDPQKYGATAERAAAYVDLAAQFAAALAATQDPRTATRSAVFRRNEIRRSLEALSRELVRLVRGQAQLTPQELVCMGLAPRQAGAGTRIGKPDLMPCVTVQSVQGRRVNLCIQPSVDVKAARRPRGASAAVVYVYIGAQPPASEDEWRFWGVSSKATAAVHFNQPDLQPGTRVWLVARWMNPRGVMGPSSRPVFVYPQTEVPVSPGLRAA